MGVRTNYNDLTKSRRKWYGRLRVKEDTGERTSGGHAIWLCECRCGKRVKVIGINLVSGNTQSCGCYRQESSYAKGGVGSRKAKV